jgi:16S rRNA (cytosine967-C5)-methyltransferase
MENRGRILCFDRDGERLAKVREAADRMGITIVQTREGPVEALALEHAASCHAVLVDAPCSNLGVLRRHPEVKWRRQPADLAASAASQRSILRAAADMVKPGGRLVYATCSLEPEENDAVTHDLLCARGDYALDPPSGFPVAPDASGVIRCLPHHHGTDGFTAVRMRRAP